MEEAVAIKSVSAWPDTRQEIFRMVKWAGARLEELGACIELKELGKQVTLEFLNLHKITFYFTYLFCRLCMMEPNLIFLLSSLASLGKIPRNRLC